MLKKGIFLFLWSENVYLCSIKSSRLSPDHVYVQSSQPAALKASSDWKWKEKNILALACDVARSRCKADARVEWGSISDVRFSRANASPVAIAPGNVTPYSSRCTVVSTVWRCMIRTLYYKYNVELSQWFSKRWVRQRARKFGFTRGSTCPNV